MFFSSILNYARNFVFSHKLLIQFLFILDYLIINYDFFFNN